MKKFIIGVSGGVIFTILTKIESLWSLINLIFNTGNMETIQISSQLYWVSHAINMIVTFIVASFVIYKILQNRERINIFHWMYDYKFGKIKDYYKKIEKSDEVSFCDESELMFMLDKIGRKYPNKSRTEKIKLLKPHYSKFLDKDSPDYINLTDKPVK
ncbi:MAG: hypothetical protein K8R54_17035 [Bacteroidales bacterium]|nr:hypothetical protein [Bacteroidales bacterium]